jgi:hypothetical protein
MESPYQHHIRALAAEATSMARLMQLAALLAAALCAATAYTSRPGWSIAFGCFAFAFWFLRCISARDARALHQHADSIDP